MKKRLNFLCVLVFVLMASSVVPTVLMMVESVKQGVEMAKNGAEFDEQHPEKVLKMANLKHPAVISTIPVAGDAAILHDAGTGRDIEVWPTQMILDSGVTENDGFDICISIVGVVGSLFQLVMIVTFIMLIVRVNRDHIFEWKNVRLLRILGGSMIAFAVLGMTVGIMLVNRALDVFNVPGYVINYMDYTQIANLILGVIALIVAEVFAMGLKQQEELELTV